MSNTELVVVDNSEERRFELQLAQQWVGHADYSIHEQVMTIPHVETSPAHRGQGFAAVLMDGVIAAARERHLLIQPVCPYAAQFMRDRADTQDLLAR